MPRQIIKNLPAEDKTSPNHSAGSFTLMDSLAKMEGGDVIVKRSKSFINNLPSNEYLNEDRLKLKAKLGVALSVFYPDKVFSQFDQQLQMVDWSKSTTLAKCLSELIKI